MDSDFPAIRMMSSPVRVSANPFEVTKADKLNTSDVMSLWAEPPTHWNAIIQVSEGATARFIIGGKGSGRTHLMRFQSLQSAALHPDANGHRALALWCGLSELSASRFGEKGLTSREWVSLFGYSLELHLAQLTIQLLGPFLRREKGLDHSFATEAARTIVGAPDSKRVSTSGALMRLLREMQDELDQYVNDSSMERPKGMRIRASPGSLVFGVPDSFRSIDQFSDVRFLYLLDELENVPAELQPYVQSLVRASTGNTTVIVGSRRNGLRTFETLTGESNREGSEFRTIALDDVNLARRAAYATFARGLLARRLRSYLPIDLRDRPDDPSSIAWLRTRLAETPHIQPESGLDRLAFVTPSSLRRKHMVRLRRQLSAVVGAEQAESMVKVLAVPSAPLIEKANVFLLYRRWARRSAHLAHDAEAISRQGAAYLSGSRIDAPEHRRVFEKYMYDLLAQLYRDSGHELPYAGLATYVVLSEGNPRNLINLFYYTFEAARFRGERPFLSSPVSLVAQGHGVREAARWFLRDAPETGDDARHVVQFIERLANLLRELRFSEKPFESSCCAFSVDVGSCSPQAQRVLELATGWSLLIEGRHKDRNSKRVIQKFQLSAMLAPLWDLPIARRGILDLDSSEVESLCQFDSDDRYQKVLQRHLRGCRPPFTGGAQEMDLLSLPI